MLRPSQIEARVIRVLRQLGNNQPVEDDRVELKSTLIQPEKAARLIAGHANAARGEPILWIVGVDEKGKKIVGVNHEEIASWYQQVASNFSGLAPRLRDLNIPIGDKTIVALLFETDRSPFVVKNLVFGKPGGGPVSYEVPWREGTSVRSSSRDELLMMLTPQVDIPTMEILSGELIVKDSRDSLFGDPKGIIQYWFLELELYVETTSTDLVVIPFHKSFVDLKLLGNDYQHRFQTMKLKSAHQKYFDLDKATNSSFIPTIATTESELLIRGPGKVVLEARSTTEYKNIKEKTAANIYISLEPLQSSRNISLDVYLPRQKNQDDEHSRWQQRSVRQNDEHFLTGGSFSISSQNTRFDYQCNCGAEITGSASGETSAQEKLWSTFLDHIKSIDSDKTEHNR